MNNYVGISAVMCSALHVIFTRAACEPAHSYGWGSWLNTAETARIRPHAVSVFAGECGVLSFP